MKVGDIRDLNRAGASPHQHVLWCRSCTRHRNRPVEFSGDLARYFALFDSETFVCPDCGDVLLLGVQVTTGRLPLAERLQRVETVT